MINWIRKFVTQLQRQIFTQILGPYRRKRADVKRLTNASSVATKTRRGFLGTLFSKKGEGDHGYTKRTIFGYHISKKLVIFFLLAVLVLILLIVFFTRPTPAPNQPSGRQPETVRATTNFRYDNHRLNNFTGQANIISRSNYLTYSGHVANGVARGLGYLFNPAWGGALRYRGYFENNQFHGRGRLYFQNGRSEYYGYFRNNYFHGEGRLYLPDGRLHYRGWFYNGVFHGQGDLISEDGVWRYYGQFANGVLNGRARIYENNVLTFEGEFLNGERHGTGTIYDSSTGFVHYTGGFQNGEFHGMGTLYDEQGRHLFSGPMLNNLKNFRHLMDATLADITVMFRDTPIVFYSDGGYAHFFFERAGVLISTNTRVRVVEDGVTFETEPNVWQSEMLLDGSRVFVQKITIFVFDGINRQGENGRFSSLPNVYTNIFRNESLPTPTTIEDFIMIDFMQRQGFDIYSSFIHIRNNFNVDRQHQLLQRIYQMCFTIPISQTWAIDGGFRYRFYYADTSSVDGNVNSSRTAVYFSIENL